MNFQKLALHNYNVKNIYFHIEDLKQILPCKLKILIKLGDFEWRNDSCAGSSAILHEKISCCFSGEFRNDSDLRHNAFYILSR